MVSDPSRWQSSAPIRYPDPDIVVLDKRFRHLVVPMAAIERVATGFRFTEGPVYYGDGSCALKASLDATKSATTNASGHHTRVTVPAT